LRDCPCAALLGIALQPLEVRTADDLDDAMKMATTGRADALVSVSTPMLGRETRRIAALALQHKLPTMFPFREFVRAGGLAAYGPSVDDQLYRAALYVDKILRGTRPADLPIEQPSEFDFTLNLKTAQALGLSIPQPVLVQATEIVQ
jgi:putative ABC transport system substrate-binding protein